MFQVVTAIAVVLICLVAGCDKDDEKKKKPVPPKNGGNTGTSLESRRDQDHVQDPQESHAGFEDREQYLMDFVPGIPPEVLSGSLQIDSVKFASRNDIQAYDTNDPDVLNSFKSVDFIEGSSPEQNRFVVEICLKQERVSKEVLTSYHMLEDEGLFIESSKQAVTKYVWIYSNQKTLDDGVNGKHKRRNCHYNTFKFNEHNLPMGDLMLLIRVRDKKMCQSDYTSHGTNDKFGLLDCDLFSTDIKNKFDMRYDSIVTIPVRWQ